MSYKFKYLHSLPEDKKVAVGDAVVAHMDKLKSDRMDITQRVARGETKLGEHDLISQIIKMGEGSDLERDVLTDTFAKRMLEGENLENIQKAPTYLVNDNGVGSVGGDNSGLMNQAYGNMFYEEASKESTFFGEVDLFQMQAPTQKIDRFKRGTRLLYPGNFDPSLTDANHTGRELNEARYFGYETGLTEFSATQYTGVVNIPREDVKDNIIGGNLIPYVLGKAVSQQMPYDMADLIINGDTAILAGDVTANPELSLLKSKDGVLKLAGLQLDLASAPINAANFTSAKKLIPIEHRRYTRNAKLWIHDNAVLDYTKVKTDSVTDQGFLMGINDFPQPRILGTPMNSLMEMPTGKGLYFDPKMNVKFGIWDAVRIDSKYFPETDEYRFYIRTRFDFTIMEPQEIVRLINVA
jgi:hypothetical protein